MTDENSDLADINDRLLGRGLALVRSPIESRPGFCLVPDAGERFDGVRGYRVLKCFATIAEAKARLLD